MSDEELTTQEMKAVQSERAQREGEEAEHAEQPEEERAHRRRSDKAAYLRDKLADQAESQEED